VLPFGRGKAINILYSECVFVALVIQHAMRMSHFCGLSGCTIFFHITSQTARISKCGIEHRMCLDFYLQIMSLTFLILRRNEPDMIKNVYWSSYKVVAFHFRFQWNCNYHGSFSKIHKYQIS